MPIDRDRLASLLIHPRESLDIELKNWLNLSDNEGKATLAKALLAMANHGGGFVILGLDERDTGAIESAGRPLNLDSYSQDLINGIVESYADPPFHCEVVAVPSPTGELHPIIIVPGEHRVPIRAKRAGPNDRTVQLHSIYVRRPGPKSEAPQSSKDWDDLFARCLSARRDELLDAIRGVLSGNVGAVPPHDTGKTRLEGWITDCLDRWHSLVDRLEGSDPRRCPNGYHWFAYQLDGDLKQPNLSELLEVAERSVVRYTGWPAFWVPTREGIEPYPQDSVIECWHGRSQVVDASYADFWRLSPDGFAFLLRGYREDDISLAERYGFQVGAKFDLVQPIWHNAEVLSHAERLAQNLARSPEAVLTANYQVHYNGLEGRELDSVFGNRLLNPGRISKQDKITRSILFEVRRVGPNLPEIVHKVLSPVYETFSFMRLPEQLVQQEISKLRANQF